MKELSIEEKAKVYDEVRDKIALRFGANVAKEIFSQFEESEDEKIRKIIKQSLKSYFEGKLSIGTNDVDYAMCLSWLKKQGEQKPAWSEEDERNISKIIEILHYTEKTSSIEPISLYSKEINWLKSLRPQNWTKEDRERYISCLQRLSTGNPEQPETINSKWFKEHVYPQSTWKPSDEQMEVLKNAIHIKPFENPSDSILWGLYEQLKKLKGE